MTERAASRPPPKDLLSRIAAAKAEVDKLELERKAAWSPPAAQALPCFQWECDWAPKNYHMAFGRWQAARDHLRPLERQLDARRAHEQEAVAHE